MRNRSFVLTCVTLIVLSSCKVLKNRNNKIGGTFINDKNPCMKLSFKKSNFYYLNDCDNTNQIANYVCCDTIAKGMYSINEKSSFIELSSDFNIRYNILDVSVKEKVDNTIKDSIIVLFNNSIINKIGYHKPLIYEVSLLGLYDERYKKSDESLMSFKTLESLSGVSVNIYPKIPDILLSNVGITRITLFDDIYQLKNPKTNVLEISIPDLTYEFLSLKRLNKDYINIVNENRLMWDGEEYLKNPSSSK